jgi:hypothetical protein
VGYLGIKVPNQSDNSLKCRNQQDDRECIMIVEHRWLNAQQWLWKLAVITMMASLPMGAVYAKNTNVKERAVSICNGKPSLEHHLDRLSDAEVLQAWHVLLQDSRIKGSRDAHTVRMRLEALPECDSWSDDTYIMEVRWFVDQIEKRNLIGSFEKMLKGKIVVRDNQLKERNSDGLWVSWTSLRK